MKGNVYNAIACSLTPTIATAYNRVSDDHVLENDRCVLGKRVALVLTVGQEDSLLIEINDSGRVQAVAFAPNGEYLVSGSEGVRVWRVEDGKQMATLEAIGVSCLVVSKDGRWIAAGTSLGDVFVWDTKTFEKVLSQREEMRHRRHDSIVAVDFSPDSTRLVSASLYGKGTIWDITTRQQVGTLEHGYLVRTAKYSPQGDRIATATPDSVRVWGSNDGRFLMDIKVTVAPWFNTGLLWFNDRLIVISDSKIKQFEASRWSTVSDWPVHESGRFSCIALPKNGRFIAYSTKRTVTFWDIATRTQLGLIQHPQDIRSIAVSPNDRFLAIGGEDGRNTIHSLFPITVSTLSRWMVVHVNNFLASILFP